MNTMTIFAAAQKGDTDTVLALLAQNGGVQTRIGQTALRHAALKGQSRTVASLLDGGADVNAGDGYDPFAIFIAAVASGDMETIRLVLERGAGASALSSPAGARVLMFAAARPEGTVSGDIVRLLLDWGADVQARDGDGMTALMYAARWGSPDTVLALLGRGADIDARHRYGYTALRFATIRGDARIVRLLLEKGIGPPIKDTNDRPVIRRSGYARRGR